MDKLQPIIRNRFWILAGLVLPMALYGYYAANGKLKAATSERVAALDKVKSGISSGNEPNEDYAKMLSVINDYYEKSIDEVIIDLWEHQKERMVWPAAVSEKVPDEFMGEFDLNTLITYKDQYHFIMKDLQSRAEPVMPVKDAQLATWKQKVVLAARLPQARFSDPNTRSLTPTSEEMWNAQIDVWLVDLLFNAVRHINEDKDTVANSVVRRIDRLDLLGGTGEPVLTGGLTRTRGGEGMETEMEMGMDAEYGGPGYGGGGDEMGGAGGTSSVKSKVDFDPAQEFGVGSEMVAVSGDGEDAEMTPGMAMQGMGGDSGTQLRYIAESESAPYLERGFYMSVIIMQNKIPDFVVELVNSNWPVRVVRFQVGENPYASKQLASPYGAQPGYGNDLYSGADAFEIPDFEMETALPGFGGASPDGLQGGGVGPLATNLPPEATGAMNHPDLVRLDLCGVITMYKQPLETLEKVSPSTEGTSNQNSSEPATATEPEGEGNSAPAAPAAGTEVPPSSADTSQPAAGTPPAAEAAAQP